MKNSIDSLTTPSQTPLSTLPLLRANEQNSLRVQIICRVANHAGDLPIDLRAETDLPFALAKHHIAGTGQRFQTLLETVWTNTLMIEMNVLLERIFSGEMEKAELARREAAKTRQPPLEPGPGLTMTNGIQPEFAPAPDAGLREPMFDKAA